MSRVTKLINNGRFRKKYPCAVFLNTVNQLERTTTHEVSLKVGCSTDLALIRLKELHEQHLINGKLIGKFWTWSKIQNQPTKFKRLSDLKCEF